MFSVCATCYTSFTTPRALKRHERRYHPNTKEEQIICKSCNMPFSDEYYLKRHITKFHNGKVSTMDMSYMETKKNAAALAAQTILSSHTTPYSIPKNRDSGNAQTINEDYTEKLLNLEINQQRNKDFIQENTMNLFKILEITRELARRFETSKEYQTVELNSKTYDCQICNRVFKNSNSLRNHKSRFHPKDHVKTEDQKIQDSPYHRPSL